MKRGAIVAGAAVAAGSLIAARRVDSGWADRDDDYPIEDRLLPPGDRHTVRTGDGADLAVTVSGEGPTVVLAHCWTGGREVWAPVAHQLLRDGHRVVLYDQRGHGSSTVGRLGCTIEQLGGDLRAVLEHVDGRDAVLAGHSMGGMTVQALATWHPEVVEERAKAIVLVATAASGLGRGSGDAAAARAVGARVVDRALRSPVGHALVRGSVGQAVRRHDLVTTRDLFVACSGEVRSQWLEAMLSMDLRGGIAGIGVPTTVLVGTHDRLTPPSRADELVSAIPGAQLQVLEGRGHMLPLEAPHEVAKAIALAATTP
jgi:pimeloyl-ACP methyl ester carboxylesterase